MVTPEYLDKISNELFEKHSLAALVICIQAGDELDFHYNGDSCGISWTKGNEKVILTTNKNNNVQEFDNVLDLVILGNIEGKRFMDEWDDIVLDFMSQYLVFRECNFSTFLFPSFKYNFYFQVNESLLNK